MLWLIQQRRPHPAGGHGGAEFEQDHAAHEPGQPVLHRSRPGRKRIGAGGDPRRRGRERHVQHRLGWPQTIFT